MSYTTRAGNFFGPKPVLLETIDNAAVMGKDRNNIRLAAKFEKEASATGPTHIAFGAISNQRQTFVEEFRLSLKEFGDVKNSTRIGAVLIQSKIGPIPDAEKPGVYRYLSLE